MANGLRGDDAEHTGALLEEAADIKSLRAPVNGDEDGTAPSKPPEPA